MRTITAADRSSLIKLASSLPQGDETRKAILAGLTKTSSSLMSNFSKLLDQDLKPGRNSIQGFPFNLLDSDGTYFELDPVDSNAARDLIAVLRRARFKVQFDKSNQHITVS